MCGIAGYIDKTGKYKTSHRLIRKMTDKMIHRGPDAEGQWIDERVALGHRRLSIIDPDPESDQPMFSHDGRYAVIFNGEIYNHIELKEELLQKGAVFRTKSDTEVILEAYRIYGTDCFDKFNGMWAFALYDIGQQKIILCRDRFGIKPLFIADDDDVLVFASEMKAIIAAFPQKNIANEIWIYRYLSRSSPEDADAETYFRDIKIFPPAHYMEYHLKDHSREHKRYWKVDEDMFYKKWIQGKDPVRTFKGLFESAVGLRLRADVEIGACLSGGLDSSSIVGCVSKRYRNRIHTFSSVYADEDCNEEMYIQEVEKKWGTVPGHVRPDDHEMDLVRHIRDITYHHDQPTGGASLFSSYMVMGRAHGDVKVLLDGQGADELFAGYEDHPLYHIRDLADLDTFRSRCEAIKCLTILKKMWPRSMRVVSTDTIVSLVGLRNSFLFRDEDRGGGSGVRKGTRLFTSEFKNRIKDRHPEKGLRLSSHLNTRLYHDLVAGRMPAILHNEDSNSMAFSIESRVPFLDHRIVEFAIALDGRYKIRGQWSKWIVRKACKCYLPKKVARRRDKMGFPAPFARWLREGKSRDELRKIIYAFGDRGIVPKETIDRFYRAHMDMEADLNDILFRFLSLELWIRMCENGVER